MKICLNCHVDFYANSWECPACKWSPLQLDGFVSFAPEFAHSNDGMQQDAHHTLEKLQENSFWFRKRNQLIQSMIVSYFPNARNVLEIGCGSGYVLNGIRKVLPLADLVATEIYTNGLSYAASKVSPPCQFLQADARKLPFKNEFDLVGAFDVLEHIVDDDLVIENIKQSLQPGGGVILTVPQHPWLWSKTDELACHKRRYPRKKLANMLRMHGFDILNDTSFMFFLLPLMVMQRLIESRKCNYDANNELTLPGWVDNIFAMTLTLERTMISLGLRFPIGGSRLVVARLGIPN
jgi:SAM-dependent methyltransferase